jgi:NAD(P)-dependent dehydrogenase (short-subunit alcohol dehydrogenase family)
MLLSNKNFVIVGGTSGIGFSAASAFVNEGAI